MHAVFVRQKEPKADLDLVYDRLFRHNCGVSDAKMLQELALVTSTGVAYSGNLDQQQLVLLTCFSRPFAGIFMC